MIRFDSVTFAYDSAPTPALRDATFTIEEGDLCLLVGRTGSGKSTLLRAINGLVPHFTGGRLTGEVTVAGRSTRDHAPRDLADVVGYVPQDPLSGFVTDTVEEELAYGMEAMGVAPAVMRRRVEDMLDLLGLADLRDRPLRTLSGGQRQRTAIGAALAPDPPILILDEPTSALDPGSAEDVLAAIQRLVFDLGITVVLAEHRLERVVQYADSIVAVTATGTVDHQSTAAALAVAPVVPPIADLGRRLDWSPLPVSVRDARRAAADLRQAFLVDLSTSSPVNATASTPEPKRVEALGSSQAVLTADHVSVTYGERVVLRDVSLTVQRGEIVALMGRNGAGKSTFLSACMGMTGLRTGRIAVGTEQLSAANLANRDLIRHIGLVPQEATDLLYEQSVAAECHRSDSDSRADPGTTWELFDSLCPGIDPTAHPRDLSAGQQLSLVLAIILAARPPVVLLDEPTRGLDYPGKVAFGEILQRLAADGHGIVMATHDVELVANTATRVVVLADRDVVADGHAKDVVVSSPMFAPQVAKTFRPLPVLTVADVMEWKTRLDSASAS